MKSIFELPQTELAEIFTQAAIKMGLSVPSIIEKDFWVVKSLQLLYSDESFLKSHVFKGGTSLSKCFGLIQRFSEDVDITISKSLLGFNDSLDSVASLGNKRRKRYFEELNQAAVDHVSEIAENLREKLKENISGSDWQICIDQGDRQKIIFEYPRSLDLSMYPEDAYVKPKILLEFGCRGELEPSMLVNVNTYAESAFEKIFSKHNVAVNTLNPDRTFWEKITLLHTVAHQRDEKPLQPRMARHYYDVYKLSNSEIKNSALNNVNLLKSVADHKSVYFKSKQASYETAVPGSLKLIPSDHLQKMLAADYKAMSEMFFGEVASFDEIFTEIEGLEKMLNLL